MDSEDFLLFSRNEPLHPLLDVLAENVEENELLSSKRRTQRENVSLVQYQSNSFFPWERFLVKSQQVLFFLVLLLPLIGMQNLSHPVVTHVSSSWSSGTSVSLLFESITNLFDPWESLIQEWVLSSFGDQILISTPCLPCKQLVVTSNTGPILCFPGSILSVVMIRHLLEEYIHDKPLHKIVLHCLQSWNTVTISATFRNPASIQILLNLYCCDNFSIRSPYCCNRRSWFVGSSQSKETSVLIALSTIDCPITISGRPDREGIHNLHTFPRLLRKDWADSQKQLCEK